MKRVRFYDTRHNKNCDMNQQFCDQDIETTQSNNINFIRVMTVLVYCLSISLAMVFVQYMIQIVLIFIPILCLLIYIGSPTQHIITEVKRNYIFEREMAFNKLDIKFADVDLDSWLTTANGIETYKLTNIKTRSEYDDTDDINNTFLNNILPNINVPTN